MRKVVRITGTKLRKDLFQIVERALQGELVEVVHKRGKVRLGLAEKPSKISRLIQRDAIHGTLDDLERAQTELDSEMRSLWEEKWVPKL
jgi:hypothetical protein